MAVGTSDTVPGPARRGRLYRLWALLRDWRFTVGRVRSLVRSMLTSFLVLSATLWLLPGVNASGLVSMLWLVVVVSAVGALLRPVLLALATVLGGLGALSLGIVVQSIIMYVALVLDPQVDVASFGAAFVASWLAVALAALVNWLADAGTDDAFISETVRLMGRIHRHNVRSGDGLLVVQLDGVSAPLLRWAVRAGNLPNIGRLLHTGSHRLAGWHTGVPATTPAVQAGILHGDMRQVPGFRWYEKETGRLLVTNRPRDAAEVERRLSNGRGLLRDGGASISNIFSGDAPLSLLTVSRAALPGRSARGYASFMMYGFPRALVLGVGEVFKELHQARVQRRRDVQPRVRRGGAYLALRPATNVLLRDLNVSLIAEQMALGAPVIFSDFVDYDEVAHHAGPARPESLSALEGLDRVVGILQRLSAEAARRYHLVVLSDHGQSQGATFRQRFGEPVEKVVHRLAHRGASVAEQERTCPGATRPVEHWGPVNALLTDIAGRPGPAGAATRAAVRSRTQGAEVALGPAAAESRAVDAAAAEAVVVASGNLAMVYLTRHPGRLARAQLDAAYPGLVDGLAAHPGIGIVVVRDDDGPVAVGDGGAVRLADGTVSGVDPLLPYGPRARADLLRHQQMDHVGDLVLISLVDPATDEVAAFEELVGCHGGLGGWQTDAMLVHPAAWPRDADELVGADAVHHQLVGWLRRLGLRTADAVAPAGPVAPADPVALDDPVAPADPQPAGRTPAEAGTTTGPSDVPAVTLAVGRPTTRRRD